MIFSSFSVNFPQSLKDIQGILGPLEICNQGLRRYFLMMQLRKSKIWHDLALVFPTTFCQLLHYYLSFPHPPQAKLLGLGRSLLLHLLKHLSSYHEGARWKIKLELLKKSKLSNTSAIWNIFKRSWFSTVIQIQKCLNWFLQHDQIPPAKINKVFCLTMSPVTSIQCHLILRCSTYQIFFNAHYSSWRRIWILFIPFRIKVIFLPIFSLIKVLVTRIGSMENGSGHDAKGDERQFLQKKSTNIFNLFDTQTCTNHLLWHTCVDTKGSRNLATPCRLVDLQANLRPCSKGLCL